MIKAVLIDIDNTLLDFNKCAKLSMKMAFDFYGLNFEDRMFDVFIKTNNEFWSRIEKREIDKDYLHKHRFNTVLSRLNIQFDGTKIESLFRLNLKEIAIPVNGAEDLLTYLSEKYSIYVVSNAFYEQQKKRLNFAGLSQYITDYFISEKIKHDKPSKEFFEYVFNALPCYQKNEMIIIGDSLSADIKGGYDSGLKTVWFNPQNQAPKDIIPDYTVTELIDIKNIL